MRHQTASTMVMLPALTADGARAGDADRVHTTVSYDGAALGNLRGSVTRSSTDIGNLHLRSLHDLDRATGWRDTRASSTCCVSTVTTPMPSLVTRWA